VEQAVAGPVCKNSCLAFVILLDPQKAHERHWTLADSFLGLTRTNHKLTW